MRKIYIATPVDFGNYGNRLQNFAVHRICEKINLEPITLAVEYSYKGKFIPKHFICEFLDKSKASKFLYKKNGMSAVKKSQRAWDFTKQWIKTVYVQDSKQLNQLLKDNCYVGIGGDQIWSECWHSRIPFCNFQSISSDRKICFAPSFGSDSLPGTYASKVCAEIALIEKPAVRESSGAAYIKKYCKKDAFVICDPVVTLKKEEWEYYASSDSTPVPSNPYILTYFLGKPNSESRAWIEQQLAEQRYDVIDLASKTVGKLRAVSPLGFVRLIANSAVLLTDSFHGLMFSLIFNKPVVIFPRSGGEKMNTRIDDVVKKYQIQDQRFQKEKNIAQYMKSNFEFINCILANERNASMEYYSSFGTGVLECYRAYNTDDKVRMGSSSGGVFTAFANTILRQNGVVYGAALDEDGMARIKRVESAAMLDGLRGSKYVQAEVGNSYEQVCRDLENGRKVLFCSTPCKVNGLVKYLGKVPDGLYLIDLICHGAPGGGVWKTYFDMLNRKKAIQNVNFRDKRNGWYGYGFGVTYQDGTSTFEGRYENPYMRLFLGNVSLRPSCYDCRAKGEQRAACITIGDLWSAKDSVDSGGYTVSIVHNLKGQELWSSSEESICSIPIPLKKALGRNINYHRSVGKPFSRDRFFKDYEQQGEKVFEDVSQYLKDSYIQKGARYIRRKLRNTGIFQKNKDYIIYPAMLRKGCGEKNKFSCCGCGACTSGCPVGAIEMKYDNEGCLYPVIDAKQCINCGKCEKICKMKIGNK